MTRTQAEMRLVHCRSWLQYALSQLQALCLSHMYNTHSPGIGWSLR